jgi:hypothetical protein
MFVKTTKDRMTAACHSVDTAQWQKMFDGLMARVADDETPLS